MKKPQISKFNEWALNEQYRMTMTAKHDLSIEELCSIGKKTSFARAFVMKESKLNESYSFILESEDLLEALEMQVAYDFINSDMALQEGFKDFAKSIFGDKVVAAVSSMPSKVLDLGSKILDKGKDVWDKAVTGLKDFLGKAKEIIANIMNVMKNFLGKLWDLIKLGMQKVGKFMFTKHMDKLEKIKTSAFSSSEAEEDPKLQGAPMVEEIQSAGSEYSEMISKYFKKDKFDTVEKAAEEAANNIQESVVWDSFVGLYSICEAEEMEELFNFVNESGDEHGEHPEKSKIVAWVQSIVQWILSPIGAAVELVATGLTKVAMSTPSAIVKGIKNYTKYSHLPALAAILAGIVADVWGIKGGIEHMSHAHESVVNEAEGDAIFSTENFKKVGESVAKVATSAIAGYAVMIAMHSLPPLHITFEAIMLSGLVIMFFGWLAEQGVAENKIPKLCTEFYHWIH